MSISRNDAGPHAKWTFIINKFMRGARYRLIIGHGMDAQTERYKPLERREAGRLQALKNA